MEKNEIFGIAFIRRKKATSITLHLKGKIPEYGYGTKQIIKMLKKFETKNR